MLVFNRFLRSTCLALLIVISGCADQALEQEQVGSVGVDSSALIQTPLIDAVVSQEATQDSMAVVSEDEPISNMRLQDAGEAVQNFGMRAFWAVVFLAFTFLFNRFTIWLLDQISERSAERRLFYKRLVPLARLVIWSLALYVIIRVIFGIDAQSLLAATAAIGVAVGFAAQDLLKNIFGGLVIISDRPFQVGDKINVGGTYGEVTAIGLRSTRIVTPDDNLVTVPNAQVLDSQVANANAGALDCQVVTKLYLPGWVDERRAKSIAYEAAVSSKYVYRNKPVVVLVKDEFKETFLTLVVVKAYVLDTRHEFRLVSDITERCRERFREEGLMIPSDARFVAPGVPTAKTADGGSHV